MPKFQSLAGVIHPDIKASVIDFSTRAEQKRIAQREVFQTKLEVLTRNDLQTFMALSIYVLGSAAWTLVEDLRRTSTELTGETALGKTRKAQLEYFQTAVVRSLISMMLQRGKKGSYSVRLLEAMMT